MAQFLGNCADKFPVKAILSVAVYLGLLFALGFAMAFTVAPEAGQTDSADDEV